MPAILSKQLRVASKRRAEPVLVNDMSWPLSISREEFICQLRAEYTPEVCARTLALNESLPVDGGR